MKNSSHNRLFRAIWVVMTAVLIAVLIVPSYASPLRQPHKIWRGFQSDLIREAVFGFQMQEVLRVSLQSVRPYFLEAKNMANPDDAIMQYFHYNRPSVRKVSSSVMGISTRDKQTGEKGIILEAATITWVMNDRVEVSGATIYGNQGGIGGVYQVQFANGKWIVYKFLPKWQS